MLSALSCGAGIVGFILTHIDYAWLVSNLADMASFLGPLKMITEAIFGQDLVTHAQLSPEERMLEGGLGLVQLVADLLTAGLAQDLFDGLNAARDLSSADRYADDATHAAEGAQSDLNQFYHEAEGDAPHFGDEGGSGGSTDAGGRHHVGVDVEPVAAAVSSWRRCRACAACKLAARPRARRLVTIKSSTDQ